MPTLTIGEKKVRVGDEFLTLSPEEQNAAVARIAGELGIDGASGDDKSSSAGRVSADNLVRAAARGIPILGGAADQFAAIMDAATHGVLGRGSDAATFAERRKANLEAERAKDKAFDEESPVASTVAKLAGGVGPFIGAAQVPKIASAIGLTGPLRQQVVRGGLSGGAISAADAAVRGGDVEHEAETGAMFSALAPVAGRAIGSVYRAVKDRLRPPATPVPQVEDTVGGIKVLITQAQDESLDPAVRAGAAHRLEMARKGALGEGPQREVLAADQAQSDQLDSLRSTISSGLDPTGRVARTSPQQAGEVVVSEAQRLAAAQAAARAAAQAAADAEASGLRQGMGGAPLRPGDAAEVVGGGVERAAARAAADRTAGYRAAEEIPAEFDPSIRNIGEELRTRLNAPDRPDRYWVDRDTTSAASKALRALSDTEEGVFFNQAAPRAPAAAGEVPVPGAPVAAPVAPVVDDTVAQIRAKYGDEVARAYEAQAAASGPAGGVLAPHDVAVANGSGVRVTPRVVEAGDVLTSADKGYPAVLQPRNRDRAASQQQVNDIAKGLDPKRLGASSEADRGAPIIGPDGVVESGNGRIMALRKVYTEGGEKASAYRQWLADQGVDVSKFKNPVLVRERSTPMSQAEREAFAIGANQSSTLSMSAAEKALADAKLLDDAALASIKNASDLGAVENRGFIRQFFGRLPQTERGALMTSNGDLSAEGLTRVRNAVLAKAYGDSPILARIAESTSDDVRSISNALTQAAPEWAALRGAIEAGSVPAEMDITKHLVDAVSRTARLRAKGGSLESALAQSDAFGGQSDESARLMRMFYGADGKSAASASQIAGGLRHYAQEAAKVDASPGLGLGLPPVKPTDILETAAARAGAPKALDEALAREATAAKPERAQAIVDAIEEAPKPVTAKQVEQARKRLVEHYTDARNKFFRSGEGASDLRAMSAIMHEFDNVIRDMVKSGKVTGDAEGYLAAIENARSKHAFFRQLFSRQSGDLGVGQAIEKIVGKGGGGKASPDEIIRMGYGSESSPGGGQAARVAAQLKRILGADSEGWKTYKQGLFSYLVERPDGGMRAPEQIAERIGSFLNSAKGNELAKQAFTEAERRSLARYADTQRGLVPQPQSRIDKIMHKIAGGDDAVPMSSADVVDLLMSRVGKGNKSLSVELVKRMKQDFTPEGWTSLRQGIYDKLTYAGEGKIEMQAQAMSQRMHEFLNESGRRLAETLFSPQELTLLRQQAAIYKKMIPPKGAAPNTSNTASTLVKLLGKTQGSLLPLLGFSSGGMPGAAVGAGVDRFLAARADRKALREVQELLYGEQPKAPRSALPELAAAKAIVRGAGVEAGRD